MFLCAYIPPKHHNVPPNEPKQGDHRILKKNHQQQLRIRVNRTMEDESSTNIVAACDMVGTGGRPYIGVDQIPERPWIMNYRKCRTGRNQRTVEEATGLEAKLASRLNAQMRQRKHREYRAALGLDDYGCDENNINKVTYTYCSPL